MIKIQKNIETNNKNRSNIEIELTTLKSQKEELEIQLEHEAKLLQSAMIGLSDAGVQPQSITDLLIACSGRLTSLKSNLDSVQQKIKQLNVQLKEKDSQLRQCLDETCVEEKQVNSVQKELSKLTKSLENLRFDPDVYDDHLRQQ
ncbi:hypothetical protein RF11_02257 [Thelohanellus kitauei]|uniref:Uncharacterized protein n=1 Tax=Thelohanellus kitauei TaxID=669202 RepID=A0A0C2IDQ4_THEKT|nr:hypothetical protein RF11_02257 [Thelohanellus kitauei]